MPIEWMIEEESPIGTRIGNLKEVLLSINNNSQIVDRVRMQLNINNDTQAFHFNASTGLICSNSRLDYEQKTSYSFSIVLYPTELHCSLFIIIKLINIPDNPIVFDQKSLVYTIHPNNPLPFPIGRIRLVDPDQLFSFQYKYYLKNLSSEISIDLTTGSIILLTKLPQKSQYEFYAVNNFNQKKLTDRLIINIREYFSEKGISQCFLDEQKTKEIVVCTIGKESADFSYYLIDPFNRFDILSNNGTIIQRKISDSEMDRDEYNVTIVVRDRETEVNT